MIAWRKASRSTSTGGECVEVGRLPRAIAFRDSKDPDGPKLAVTRDAFANLIADLKR
ncbi:DUF397 domain-containing protein [Actinomadura madurae]|uniref:DUF397 domain-containing protein n=1 Tax=Actinomadura madurae TaxID=1993 RepID=UPI000D8E9842|nr:Domain of uncharacterised function (DUF397) [Actinomadura madurae]